MYRTENLIRNEDYIAIPNNSLHPQFLYNVLLVLLLWNDRCPCGTFLRAWRLSGNQIHRRNFWTKLHNEKSTGVISNDLGGHMFGPLRPVKYEMVANMRSQFRLHSPNINYSKFMKCIMTLIIYSAYASSNIVIFIEFYIQMNVDIRDLRQCPVTMTLHEPF
jgi:hypothetical protein